MNNLNDNENLIKLVNDLKITNFSIYNYEDGSKSIEFYRNLETVDSETKIELPEKYTITEDITTLYWKDGTYTTVKRCEDDEFNPRLAFLTAFFQKYSGMSKNKANKYLADLRFKPKERLVKVTSEQCFPFYYGFIKRYFPEYVDNFKTFDVPSKGKIYKYIGQKRDGNGMLTLIQDRDTKQVYITFEHNIKDYKPKHAKEEN